MNALRCTWIVCSTVSALLFLALAVIAPVWITPDNYTWTVIGLGLFVCESVGLEKRIRDWAEHPSLRS